MGFRSPWTVVLEWGKPGAALLLTLEITAQGGVEVRWETQGESGERTYKLLPCLELPHMAIAQAITLDCLADVLKSLLKGQPTRHHGTWQVVDQTVVVHDRWNASNTSGKVRSKSKRPNKSFKTFGALLDWLEKTYGKAYSLDLYEEGDFAYDGMDPVHPDGSRMSPQEIDLVKKQWPEGREEGEHEPEWSVRRNQLGNWDRYLQPCELHLTFKLMLDGKLFETHERKTDTEQYGLPPEVEALIQSRGIKIDYY